MSPHGCEPPVRRAICLSLLQRGPKKHLKRLNAPSAWLLSKMGGVWAPKPTAGPHKSNESIPLVLLLRNRLKYALTRQEATMICMQKLVKVDGRVRTEIKFPLGFMDVLTVEKSGDRFRVMYDTKGRFKLHPINAREASYKLCRVARHEVSTKGIPVLITHDGRTIRYPDPVIKRNDTIKLDLESGKIVDHIKLDIGTLVFVTRGHNTGRAGVLVGRDRHPGSFDIVHIQDASGQTFATRLSNIFVIGKDSDPRNALVTIPKGGGVKQSIFQQRDARLRH